MVGVSAGLIWTLAGDHHGGAWVGGLGLVCFGALIFFLLVCQVVVNAWYAVGRLFR